MNRVQFPKPCADLHVTCCSVEDYGVMLKDAGFANVVAEDRTWQVNDAPANTLC